MSCSDWSDSEQSPDQFLKTLSKSRPTSGADDFPLDSSEPDADFVTDSSRPHSSPDVNPFEEAVAGGDAAVDTEQPVAVSNAELLTKKQAQRLIRESRNALASGDTALARSRALQARQLNASWGLWDDRPEHVLADLDKKSKTSTFVPGGRATAATPEIRSKDIEHSWQQANVLLSQARAAMDAGKLSEAQQLADKAATFDVAYGIFEDSPTMVSRDIKRLAGSGSVAFEAFSSKSDDASPDADQARQLLREAREALTQGRLTEARDKAKKASSLNVTYNVLDDRPELVLNDVESAQHGQGQIQSPRNADTGIAKNDSAAASGVRQLVADARTALNDGETDVAQQFAVQAQQQDVAYGLMEDRPELVLEEARLMARRDADHSKSQELAQGGPVDVTPAGNPTASNPFGRAAKNSEFVTADFPVIAPDQLSADEAFRRGIELFRSGDRAGAKLAFAQAWKNAGELSGVQRRQVQDFLQDLANRTNEPAEPSS